MYSSKFACRIRNSFTFIWADNLLNSLFDDNGESEPYASNFFIPLLLLFSDQLSVYPTYAGMFGGTIIDISGPCFTNNRNDIKCRFGQKSVSPISISATKARCVVPPLSERGRITLSLSVNGGRNFPFESPFTVGKFPRCYNCRWFEDVLWVHIKGLKENIDKTKITIILRSTIMYSKGSRKSRRSNYYQNNDGHVIKMAAMAIYGKNF